MTDRTANESPPPEAGGIGEDWLATIAGLAVLALALLGLVPDAVLW